LKDSRAVSRIRLLSEILQSQQEVEKFYLQWETKGVAKEPAFLLVPPYTPLNPSKRKWMLVMNSVAILGFYTTKREAIGLIKQVLSKQKKSLVLWKDKRPFFIHVVKG